MAVHESDVVAVRSALQQLSKHQGLTPKRLRTTVIDAGTLFALPAVQRRHRQLGGDVPEALISVVRELAQQLPATDRIIVDAELTLRLLDSASAQELDVDQLYDNELGKRRSYLVEQWQALHAAVGAADVPPTPTERSLRTTPERHAFTELAKALTAGAVHTAAPMAFHRPRIDRHTAGPVVTVIGDAVMDLVFRTDHIPLSPTSHTSTRAKHEFRPGGKGLYRAVATARLGLDVRLIAAVGDDVEGRRIIEYLRSENVDTELVRIVPNTPTPVVCVLVTNDGVTSLVSKTDAIRLGADDLNSAAARATFAATRVVLLTFEQPGSIVELLLEIVRTLPDRPVVVLHPAPPEEAPARLHQFLSVIDYLVGSPAELQRIAQQTHQLNVDEAITQLRLLGSRSVCVIENFQATVHSDTVDVHVPRFQVELEDSPAVRAVFSAALAYRLATSNLPATEADFVWATAAMVAARSGFLLHRDNELVDEIDRIIRIAEEQHRTELLDKR
ncbi:carbohydrate kinase family protein [Nocardia sp. CS682]|uniref:carbohydrate kinase family protein n=1 Tax=Nocardia sp. CS682 TaxID=1047172 RepID=UPI001074EC78|nr:carbohydrate kinase family protein [Nocardia sp. CS682]QBS39012.1 hypothetical protein DMB37_01690 [Nocardia sp. CS682]